MRSCPFVSMKFFRGLDGLHEILSTLIGRFRWPFAGGLIVLGLVGCGGGEDFSKPPEGVAEQLSKAAEKPTAKSSEKSTAVANAAKVETAEPAKSPGEAAEGKSVAEDAASKSKGETNDQPAKSEVANAPPTATDKSQDQSKSPANASTSDAKPADAKTAAGKGDQPMQIAGPGAADKSSGTSAPPTESAKKSNEEETMTASGRTAKSLEDKKDENSKMTVAENAGGLLGSLKSNKSKSEAKKSAPSGDSDAPEALTRFGRMALSQPDWLRLVTQLSRRFYVATSFDGKRILASSGERSGGVVQIETMPEFQGRYGTREAQDELLQSIASLPGQVSCLELTGDGSAALFGTEDGRVLVRMISGKHNWDLYARDLFLFQDEIRSSARLSADPIVLLREIEGGQLLSIDAKGQCAIWKIGDVIQPVPPIETIPTSNLASLSMAAVSPAPVAKFEVKGMQILSCCESADGRWVAVIASDETVTIVETATGTVFDQLTAEHFADTQPVCVAFLPERQELLAGLADGRIFRRAFGKDAAPVSGLNDQGEPVDYDAVFIPDVNDRPDSITVITPIPGTNYAYVGSVTGVLSRLDISQRRMELLPSKQGGAVLEVKVCPYGTLAIGDERKASIFDQPLSLVTRQIPAPRTLELPTDEALKDTSIPDPETAGTRRPPARTASLREPPMDQDMVGIRPPQPELALLHHQLRSAKDQDRRQTVRRSILQAQGRGDKLNEPPREGDPADGKSNAEPMLTAEFTADFVFTGRAWQDVRMACSQDGNLAVLSHPSQPGISIVDMPTGVILRRWTEVSAARQFLLNEQAGRLIPSGPASAELSLGSGALMSDPVKRYLVCAVSPNEKSTVLGQFGNAGLASNSLTHINDEGSSRSDCLEMFESMVTALAYSSGGDSLYASFRSRDQTILQELDPYSLSVRATLITEPLPGAVPADFTEALDGTCGVTFIQSSGSNKSLLTYGTHQDGPQIRLWKRSSKGWPKESVQIFRDDALLPDPKILQPVAFVNQQDSKIAIVTKTGLSIVSVKKEKLENQLPIPDVGARRPCISFSPDARWLIAGDAEGKIWLVSLSNPTRKPLSFQAHSGPIAGLAVSPNGKFMLTTGEDNRVRSWSVESFLAP